MYKLTIKLTKDLLAEFNNHRKTEFPEESSGGDGFAMCIAITKAIKDIFPYALVTHDGINPFWHTQEEMYKDHHHDSLRFPSHIGPYIHAYESSTSEGKMGIPEIAFDLLLKDWVIEPLNMDKIKLMLNNHKYLSLYELDLEEENYELLRQVYLRILSDPTLQKPKKKKG